MNRLPIDPRNLTYEEIETEIFLHHPVLLSFLDALDEQGFDEGFEAGYNQALEDEQ